MFDFGVVLSNPTAGSPAPPGGGNSTVRQPSTWRINHPADAGGPTYVTVEPTPGVRASFLRIGVTITEMYDGPLDTPLPALNSAGFSLVLKERARVAGVLLTTLGALDHFKDEPHWQREIANIAQLVADIASHLNSSR